MSKFKRFMLATWELPQNILGWIVMKATKAGKINDVGTASVTADIYHWNISGGMSLGKYIFVPFDAWVADSKYQTNFIFHEFGHSLQSRKLGWFYLLVIGLPSLVWSKCFTGYRIKHGVNYYKFCTEAWADRLGGVKRFED